MTDETETENKKIDGKIRAFSEELNLTKSIIQESENKVERNFHGLNKTMLREGFISISVWVLCQKKWGGGGVLKTVHYHIIELDKFT